MNLNKFLGLFLPGILCKITFAILLLIVTTSIYAQEVSLFTPIDEAKMDLNKGQLTKLERLKTNPLYKKLQLVKVSNLKTVQEKGILSFIIPNRKGSISAYATSVEAVSDEEFSWHGEFRGREHGSMTIISKKGAIYGQINIGDEIYALQDLGKGQNILIQLDEMKYGPRECATPHESITHSPSAHLPSTEDRSSCSGIVRVLVLYTSAAEQIDNPESAATLFIKQTNNICRNSDIRTADLEFQLAGVEELLGFSESDEIGDDLDDLRLSNAAQNLRNQYQADIVVLLTDGNYGGGSIFGVTYRLNTGDEAFAYAISEIDAAGGRFTFSHEIGHVFGARHDNDTGTHPNLSPFAHGHNFTTGAFWWKERWRTVLNSLPSGEARIQYYSNPNVEFNGKATGTNTRDNTRQIENLACTISNYRNYDAMSVAISGPTIGQNNTSYTWCANVSDCGNVNYYNWEYSYDGFSYYPFGSTQCKTANMPYNQSLHLRVTVFCSDGQTATDWHLTLNDDRDWRTADSTTYKQQTEAILAIPTHITSKVFPNPLEQQLNLETYLPEDGSVTITLVNHLGQEIQNLFTGYRPNGTHYFEQQLSDYPSGIYFIKITQNNQQSTHKIFLK